MCPLLWCRESFDSLASTLQHVSECLWLSNTWYWCPYCCRPESFMASENFCTDTTQRKLQRKDSKLRRAVTFFKHLGLKSCSRHKRLGPSSAPETESFDTWLAKRKRFEMEDTSHDTSSLMELAANDDDIHSFWSNSNKHSTVLYEVEGTTLYTSWDLDDLPQYTGDAVTAFEPCELDVSNLVVAPKSTGTAGNSDLSLTDIGAQFEKAHHDAESLEQILVSPISGIEGSFICQSARVDTSFDTECGLVSPTYSSPGTVSSPELCDKDWRHIKVTPALSGYLPSYENSRSQCDSAAFSSQSQVEELREMVRVLNEEWMRRCQTIPDLVLRISALSPKSLFETGAQALQHLFRGVLPETFDAIFALAHITCASTYIMHRDDSSHCWNEFFQDILKWQHLMLNKSEAQLFIRLVNLLWWPQVSTARTSCGNYFLDETSETLVPLRKPAVGFDTSSSTGTNGLQSSQWPTELASIPLLNSLKNGVVVQECLRFLDGKPTPQCLRS